MVDQLLDFQHRTAELMQRDGRLAEDEFFFAEQNARLIKNAEKYYRSMFRGRESWNLRDTHMAETLDALIAHLSRQGQRAKVVVWVHNSHLGDAHATQMGQAGELNVASSSANATATRPSWSASAPTAAPSPPPRIGMRRSSASACARLCRAATRRCSTP